MKNPANDHSKKRVALYLPLGKKGTRWSGLGGAEKRLSYLISHMDKGRYQPYIVFRVYEGEQEVRNALMEYIDNGCEVIFVANDKEAVFHFWKEKYDCVLYDDTMVLSIPGVIGAVLGKSYRILIFVTEYYARWSFKKKWHSLIMRFNGTLANAIDCLYPSSVEILGEIFKKKPITITPCSLPLIEEYIKEEVAKRNNDIVFAGRLVGGKNPLLLVEAAELIYENLCENEYRIIICGSGPLEPDVKKAITDKGLEHCVFYAGQQDMKTIFPVSLVFCSLQDNENYPSQSLLEAIASGCICIATNEGNTKEIVRAEFGYLIDKSPEQLAEKILEITRMDKTKLEDMSKNAVKFAKEKFQPIEAVKHYEIICNSNR